MKSLLLSSCLIGTSMLSAGVHNYSQKNNLLKNPGFEQGGWGTGSKLSSQAHSGSKALAISVKDKSVVSEIVKINPNMDYYFSLWLKGDKLKKAIGTAVIKILRGNGRQVKNELKQKGNLVLGKYQGEVIFVAGNSDWKQYVIYFPATEIPDSCTKAMVQLYIKKLGKKAKSLSGQALYDDVFFGPANLSLDLKVINNGKVDPAFLINLNTNAVLDLGVYMPGKQGKTVDATIYIKDYFGNIILQKKLSGTFDKSDGLRSKINMDKMPRGYYLAELHVKGYPVQKKAFGVINPKLKTAEIDADSPYGINIRGYYSDKVFELFQRLGFKWFRGGPNTARWSSVEKVKGKYKFDHVLKEKAFIRKYGFLRIERMQSYPKWAQQKLEGGRVARHGRQYRDRASRSFPADVEGWKKYCENTARALSGSGPNYFELWNEPAGVNNWMDTNEKFIELVKLTHANIKKGDPKAHSVMCGIQGTFVEDTKDEPYPSKDEVWRMVNPRKYFNMLMASGRSMDILNFHSYGGYMNIHKKMKLIKAAEKKYPFLKNKEIWITETGNNTSSEGIPELKNPQVYVKSHAIARSYGKAKVFWFSGINSGRDLAYNEHNFGMMHCDLMPKPTVFAHTALVEILGKGQFEKTVSLGKDITAYKFQNNGPVNIIWSEEPKLVILNMAEPLSIKNIMGNSVTPVRWGDMSLLELSENPIYVLNNIPDNCNLGTAIKPIKISAIKGQTTKASLTFYNRGKSALKHTVNFHSPTGFVIKPARITVSIPAKSSVSKWISVQNLSIGKIGLYSVKISIDSNKQKLESGINIEVPLPIKAYKEINCKIGPGEITPGQLAYKISKTGSVKGKMNIARSLTRPYTQTFRMRLLSKATNDKDALIFRIAGKGKVQFTMGIGSHKINISGAVLKALKIKAKLKADRVVKIDIYIDLKKRIGYFGYGSKKINFKLKPSFTSISEVAFGGGKTFYMTEPVIEGK